MRAPLADFHLATFVCAVRGHCTPAADAAVLRPDDSGVGVELADGRRLARCLRCDAWCQAERPAAPRWETLPPWRELELPRRGRALRDAVVLRLIAFDRAVHSVVFGLLTAALLFLELRLQVVRRWAQDLLDRLNTSVTNGGQGPSQSFVIRSLQRVLHLQRTHLRVLLVVAAAYCVVEGTEAVGLWFERRWAEYLTALATAGFLPFEIDELTRRVTVARIITFGINVAVLVYLVWRKQLFGVGRSRPAPAEEDPAEVFAPPAPSS